MFGLSIRTSMQNLDSVAQKNERVMRNLVFGAVPFCAMPSRPSCDQPMYRAVHFAPANNCSLHVFVYL